MKIFRTLFLALLLALTATACTAVGETETVVKAQIKTASQNEFQPPASTAPQAAVAEQTTASVETDSETSDMQTAQPKPTQPLAPTETPVLPVIGPAPGWHNEIWINSNAPLPLEDLRGRVVLLEFWTFG
jgi:cytoskeletal protein RodZ